MTVMILRLLQYEKWNTAPIPSKWRVILIFFKIVFIFIFAMCRHYLFFFFFSYLECTVDEGWRSVIFQDKVEGLISS